MATKDPHQPFQDIYLSEEELYEQDVERMEGEGLCPYSGKAHDVIATPRTEIPGEDWRDETAEEGEEEIHSTKRSTASMYSTVRGCNCKCPRCPEECPPTCKCAGHSRHHPKPIMDPVSGDEP